MMFFDEFKMYTWQSYDHFIYNHMQLQLNNHNYDYNASPQHVTCGAFSCIKNMFFLIMGYVRHVMWCMAFKLPHVKFLLIDMVIASIVAWTCLKMRWLQVHVCIFMFTFDSFHIHLGILENAHIKNNNTRCDG